MDSGTLGDRYCSGNLGTEVRSGAENRRRCLSALDSLQWLSQVGASYHLHMTIGVFVRVATLYLSYAVLK